MVVNTVTNTIELSVKDAAAKLGISQAGVYMRIKRNPSLSPRKGYVSMPVDEPRNSVSNNVENVSESLTDGTHVLLTRISQLEEQKSRLAERVGHYKQQNIEQKQRIQWLEMQLEKALKIADQQQQLSLPSALREMPVLGGEDSKQTKKKSWWWPW